mgnify:CR=1 FL=1
MSVYQLQIKALEEWSRSKELQREYTTPEYYWWKRYQRIYCPNCRADFSSLTQDKVEQHG